MNRYTLLAALWLSVTGYAQQTSFSFCFDGNKKDEKALQITKQQVFSEQTGYGYDLQSAPDLKANKPFYFSVAVPDGNYRVTVTLGSKKSAGVTTVRAESRRLFIENLPTRKGEFVQQSFVVNKRNTEIAPGEYVKIKVREKSKLNWDNKLTLEFNGDAPLLSALTIERVSDVPTIFLCGNSTVVDQDNEPWASWGQMIPHFFGTDVCIANYAESGESANTFIGAKRLAKALSQIKKGDYLFMEFGHNDQKIDTLDAFGGYTENLKYFVNFVREKGANPIICSPINRIIFQEDGTLLNLLGDYRTAVKNVCDEMNVPFIDLWSCTTEFFEAAGAVKAWDYFWGNGTDRDYTHTNDIGGNIVARFVANEMIKNNVQPIADLIKKDMINVEMPKHDSSVKPQNSKEIEHLKTIGLVNVPKASELADLDKDITNI